MTRRCAPVAKPEASRECILYLPLDHKLHGLMMPHRAKLLIAIATCYIAFGILLLIVGAIAASSTNGNVLYLLNCLVALILGGFTLFAGLQLWRERSLGISLCATVTALQVLFVQLPAGGFRFVAGPHWTWIFGNNGDDVFAKSEYALQSIVSIDPASTGDFVVGINVVALVVLVWLLKQSRETRHEPQAV